ncbi:MAG: hypothetical protein IJQ50_03650, partial [Clostridia bacterium]|nr:hypothetical protein [Clostridia bacterium]
MIKKLISLMTVVGIACTFLLTAVMADIQQEDFGEYPVVLADMNFDDLDTGTVIDKDTDPDKYFFKDDNGGPGGTDDEITPAVEIVEAGDRKYAKVTTYTNANEAFGISPKVTQDSLVENGLTEYPDKIKVEYDVMKDGHSQAVYGFIGYASPIANATKDWGEFMQWGSGNTFSFARQMSTPVTSSTAVALGNWAHVDLYIDFTEGTFDCFVNETYIGKADLKPGMTTPEYLSFSCYTNNKETSNLCVDNIKISAPAPEFVVKGSSPADGASIFEEIQIEISNDIVDFDYSNDMEVKCNGEDVAFEATEEDGIITVILKEGLEFGDRFIMNFDSNYVVKLNNTFCDTYGQTLAEPYEYTFRTTERTLVSTVPAIEDSEAVSYVYNPSETDSLTAKLIVSVTYNDGTSALYIDTKEIEPDKFKQLMVNISDLENVNKIFAYVTKDADTLKPLHYMYATADGAETFIGDTATVATVDRADIIRNKVEIEGSISVKEKQD